jgi:DNA-nicking Smr family endonuclease
MTLIRPLLAALAIVSTTAIAQTTVADAWVRNTVAQQKATALFAEEGVSVIDADSRFEVTDDGRHVEGRRVDVPPADLRKLRRGQRPVDARLDLHGKTAVEARDEVARFLGAMRARGERCVLVIHGKGKGSPGGSGVLRGEIAAWLSQGPASAHVDAFASADADDGGEGAVYVQLRR